MFKKNHEVTLYDYNFKKADGTYIGEKLCMSHAHAEKMRQAYEEKYGCPVKSEFWHIVVKKNGRTVYGV